MLPEYLVGRTICNAEYTPEGLLMQFTDGSSIIITIAEEKLPTQTSHEEKVLVLVHRLP